MKNQVKVDIIIPFFNKAHLVIRCLNSVRRAARLPVRIILINDGSTPEETGSIEEYLRNFPFPAEVVTHSSNMGYKEAIKTGLKHIRSDYIILLNNDTVVTAGFDEKLVGPLLEYDHLAATGPVSNHPTDLYQYRGNLMACTSGTVEEYQARLSGAALTDTPYLTGMCLALHYTRLNNPLLFDDPYRHGYFEDLALCCRIREKGYTLGIREDCLVYHDGHATYKEKEQSEKQEIIIHNFKIFQSEWGHLNDHSELLDKMDYAGKVCPI